MAVRALASLDARVRRLQDLEPLPEPTRASLLAALRTRVTQASTAIEGNHLTIRETQLILEGITVGGKPLRDHLEVLDHAEAWDAMVEWARSEDAVTPFLVRSLHALVMRRSQPDIAGQLRTAPVAIAGSPLVPPDPVLVPGAVADWCEQWRLQAGHPVQVGAAMHAALMAIHPFTDGNGRTGRLLLTLWLMRHHYPPALLEPRDRKRYYAALQAADGGDPRPITRVVGHGIARTVTLYERVLGLPSLPAPTPVNRP